MAEMMASNVSPVCRILLCTSLVTMLHQMFLENEPTWKAEALLACPRQHCYTRKTESEAVHDPGIRISF